MVFTGPQSLRDRAINFASKAVEQIVQLSNWASSIVKLARLFNLSHFVLKLNISFYCFFFIRVFQWNLYCVTCRIWYGNNIFSKPLITRNKTLDTFWVRDLRSSDGSRRRKGASGVQLPHEKVVDLWLGPFVLVWVGMKVIFFKLVFMALGINQVTYSGRKFCRSVCWSVGRSVCLSVPILLV